MTSATPRSTALAAAATGLAAALVSVQARMNGELSVIFNAPLAAALWSFASGLVLLTIGLFVPAVRRGLGRLRDQVRSGGFPLWLCLGGAMGGLFVAAQTYAVPLAGVAVYTIAVVGGQTGNALLVDRLGIGPHGRTPVTAGRVVAAVLAVAGVALAVTQGSATGTGLLLLPVVVALLSGAMNTVQQAMNGRVGVQTRNPFATTWLNFATGTIVLVLCLLVVGLAGGPAAPKSTSAPWWAWFGSICGIVFISVASVSVRVLGVLVFTLVVLVGQLSAAVVLDLLNPEMRDHVGPRVYLGVLVTALAVALGAASSRRRRTAAPAPPAIEV